jgi:trimethylamine--corrinoid protein Co-methyltransferase
MSGYLLVEPRDVAINTAHLHMLQANIRYSDKPFIGSSDGRTGSQHTINLIKILFGENTNGYYTLGLINPLSPLRYSKDMLNALLIYARANQPLVFSTLVMAGSTGPITIPGVIAQQNAELLAGIVLAQLIQPGLPIIYGSTSTNTDMSTCSLSIGSPELSLCISIHAQLGRRYQFPIRGGGALTDASQVDAQAGYESMFSLLTALFSGVDFILHAAGIMSSYLAFSFEKFVIDDELCGMVKHFRKGVEVSPETLAFDVIQQVKQNGHYLNQSHTLERCRTEFFIPKISDRSGLDTWWNGDRLETADRASQRWRDLLRNYQEPHLDSLLDKQIQMYITKQES